MPLVWTSLCTEKFGELGENFLGFIFYALIEPYSAPLNCHSKKLNSTTMNIERGAIYIVSEL